MGFPTSVGLSAIKKPIHQEPMACQTAALVEGAVVAHQTGGGSDDANCIAVSGAAAKRTAGVLVDAQPSGGTTAGDIVNVCKLGVCAVLLKAGQSVVRGDKLITAGTDGSVKAWTNETDVDIIGVALMSATAGSNNDLITAWISIYHKT